MDVSRRAMGAAQLLRLVQHAIRGPDQAANGRREHTAPPEITISRVASLLNVSLSLAQAARGAIMRGVCELAAEVKAGVISVTAAPDLSRLPADMQRRMAENPTNSAMVAKAIRTQDPAVGLIVPDEALRQACPRVDHAIDPR